VTSLAGHEVTCAGSQSCETVADNMRRNPEPKPPRQVDEPDCQGPEQYPDASSFRECPGPLR